MFMFCKQAKYCEHFPRPFVPIYGTKYKTTNVKRNIWYNTGNSKKKVRNTKTNTAQGRKNNNTLLFLLRQKYDAPFCGYLTDSRHLHFTFHSKNIAVIQAVMLLEMFFRTLVDSLMYLFPVMQHSDRRNWLRSLMWLHGEASFTLASPWDSIMCSCVLVL